MIYFLKIGCKGTTFYLFVQIFHIKKHLTLHILHTFVQYLVYFFTIFRASTDNFRATLQNSAEKL